MNRNVRIARELVRIAKTMAASDIDEDKLREKIGDTIERLVEWTLLDLGWSDYDWAEDITEDGEYVGTGFAVEPDESGGSQVEWSRLKSKVEGVIDGFDTERKFVVETREYGPTGYEIIVMDGGAQ